MLRHPRSFVAVWVHYRQFLTFWDAVSALAAYKLPRLTLGWCRLLRYRVFVQPVPGRALLREGVGRAIEIRRLEAGDPALPDLPRDSATYEYRFRQGAECLGAFKEERSVGFIWFVAGAYDEDEVYCRFVPQPAGRVAWDFDVYVTPEQRGSLVFMRLWDAAFAEMRARDITATASRISLFNPVSIAAHQRMGAEAIAKLTFLQIGRLQLALSRGRPKCVLSWGRRGQPVFRIPMPAPVDPGVDGEVR